MRFLGGILVLYGLITGAVSGAVQSWTLAVFTKAVIRGGITVKTIFIGAGHFFLPFLVLVSCAVLCMDSLIWTVISMTVMFIGLSVIRFLTPNTKLFPDGFFHPKAHKYL